MAPIARAGNTSEGPEDGVFKVGQVPLYLTALALWIALPDPRDFVLTAYLAIIVSVGFGAIGLLRSRGQKKAYRMGLLQLGIVLLIPPVGGVLMATLPLMQSIWWTIGATAGLVAVWFGLDLLNRARDLS
jgi:hypothetical protein